MTMVCRSCLIPHEDRFEIVAEDDYARLRDLIDGELAVATCAVCELPLGIEPPVAVVFTGPATVYFTPGTAGLGPDALTVGAAAQHVRCAGQDELRDQVGRRLATRLTPVQRLLEATVRGQQWHLLDRHWHEFTPPVLAAAAVAGAWLDLGGLLVRVWQALVTDWSAGTRGGLLFDDIEGYVSITALPPAAAAEVTPEFFAARTGDPYVFAAVSAAAARAAGVPDPHATTWATEYFAFEIALRHNGSRRRERVPAGFAAATINHAAAWQAVRQNLRLDDGLPNAGAAGVVQEIADAIGRPGVPAAVFQQNAVSPHEPPSDARTVVERALPLGPETPIALALAGADLELRARPDGSRIGLLDQVADLLMKIAPEHRAAIQVWWALHYLKLGRTDDADRALRGITAQTTMDAATHARFLGARADILAGRGRLDDAATRWHEAETYAVAAGDLRLRYWVRVNLAIRLQETEPGRALEILLDAAYGPEGYGADHAILGLLAGLRHRRGEVRAAIELLAQAEALASGEDAARYARQRQALLAGRSATAAPPPDVPFAGNRAEALRHAHDRAVELHNARDPAAAAAWERLVAERAEHGLPDDPQELAEAALGRLRAGDTGGMRDLLTRLPTALARRYGSAPGHEREPRGLLRPLAEIAGLLAEAGRPDADDLRLAGELQRDAVGRAQAARRGAAVPDGLRDHEPWRGVPDPALAATGPVAVVEWIQVGDERLRCLLTRVDADGSRAGWLTQERNPVPVRKQLFARLEAWSPGGADPLDDPAWLAVSGHLVEQLARHLPPGDHVVLLHHEAVANLPWHIPVQEHWTVSYAAGWSHLTGIVRRPAAARRRLGLCLVPQAGEEASTQAALIAAHDRLAGLPGVSVTTGAPAANDADALARLLADEDAVVLLCHGYHNDASEQTGFVLAANGMLPPPETVLSRRPQHLFLTGDAARLARTPPAVFTPACSTSRSYQAGLGDRLGLAATFRQSGTTAMVAPLWDVHTAGVVPVLTAVVERYLRGEPLAQAMRSAASQTAGSAPDWLIRSLALDGDWR